MKLNSNGMKKKQASRVQEIHRIQRKKTGKIRRVSEVYVSQQVGAGKADVHLFC